MTSFIENLTMRDSVRADAVARALPFFLFIAVLALRGALPITAPNPGGLDLRWLYAVQAAVACAALLALRERYRELARPQIAIAPLLATIVAGFAVFLVWIAPLPDWTHLGAPVAAFVPVAANGALRWDLIAVRGFGAALVVPVMEELFWRSFLMRWIDKRDFLTLVPGAASTLALAVSSAVFALAHDLWLCAFVAGLVYGEIYRRTGNIWYSVLAHATTNLVLAVWVVSRSAWAYW
jgi:CAAX prenyl protease-like protein